MVRMRLELRLRMQHWTDMISSLRSEELLCL